MSRFTWIPPRSTRTGPEADADEVITQLCRHTRYLLSLKGRPPFRLAGMETYERLQNVACLSLDLLAQRYDLYSALCTEGSVCSGLSKASVV